MTVALSALLGLGACVELLPPSPQPGYLADTDELVFVADQPEMIIDGFQVFFLYTVDGWGYWDAGHRWHHAPGGIAGRLDQRYPRGRGLRPSQQAAVGAVPAANRQTAAPFGGHAAPSGQGHPAQAVSAGPAAAHPAEAAHEAPGAARATAAEHPVPAAAHAPAATAATQPPPHHDAQAAASHAPAPAHHDQDCSKTPHCP
jgi:hypothetical protein